MDGLGGPDIRELRSPFSWFRSFARGSVSWNASRTLNEVREGWCALEKPPRGTLAFKQKLGWSEIIIGGKTTKNREEEFSGYPGEKIAVVGFSCGTGGSRRLTWAAGMAGTILLFSAVPKAFRHSAPAASLGARNELERNVSQPAQMHAMPRIRREY